MNETEILKRLANNEVNLKLTLQEYHNISVVLYSFIKDETQDVEIRVFIDEVTEKLLGQVMRQKEEYYNIFISLFQKDDQINEGEIYDDDDDDDFDDFDV
jgi:hypothetical protein